MSGLTRDGQACLAGPNSHARTGTGKIRFPYSADHEQDWQVYRVDPYSVESAADTYVHIHSAVLVVTSVDSLVQ